MSRVSALVLAAVVAGAAVLAGLWLARETAAHSGAPGAPAEAGALRTAESRETPPPPQPIRAVPHTRTEGENDPRPEPVKDPRVVSDTPMTCRVSGRVLAEDGSVVPGAFVSMAESGFDPKKCRSDAAGRFEFADLYPVRTTVHAYHAERGRLRVGRSEEVLLARAEVRRGLDVRLPAEPLLTVDVRHGDGAPAAGMGIRLGFWTHFVPEEAGGGLVTDHEGRWRLCGAPAAGIPAAAWVALVPALDDEASFEVRPALRQSVKAGSHVAFWIVAEDGVRRSEAGIRFTYDGPPLRHEGSDSPQVQIHVFRGEEPLGGASGRLAAGDNVFTARLPSEIPLEGLEIEVVSILGWLRVPLALAPDGSLTGKGGAWTRGVTILGIPPRSRRGFGDIPRAPSTGERTLAVLRRRTPDGAAGRGRSVAPVDVAGGSGFALENVPPGAWRLSFLRNGRALRFRHLDRTLPFLDLEVLSEPFLLDPIEVLE